MIMEPCASPALYLHVPFCAKKCPYCDFYSVTSRSLRGAWLAAMRQEMRLYKGRFACFDTLYLGGGTPSLLSSRELTCLIEELRRNFAFAPDTEVTLEVNPDDLCPEKLALYHDLGINRLSLGVQSFEEAELRFLGRRHTVKQTLQVLERVRAGCTNLGLDLMYGLPGQTAESWLRTLNCGLSFQPEHLSCYQLTLEPGTPLGRRQAAGEFPAVDEELGRNLFLLTSQFLEDHGYQHYEVSNFALLKPVGGGACYSRHNSKYWRHVPYLGLGPGAHSFAGGVRWWNHRSLARYCRDLEQGKAPVQGRETLTPEQLRLETLYLGFRTRQGVSLDVIRQHRDGDRVLAQLQSEGLVRLRGEWVTPTPEGLVVADRLPLLFA